MHADEHGTNVAEHTFAFKARHTIGTKSLGSPQCFRGIAKKSWRENALASGDDAGMPLDAPSREGQEQVFVTRSAHRGGCELECVLVAKEQCDKQPVYLSVKEAEFPQRNSVNPNILRLEANRVCTYISATEGRGD